MKISVIVPVYNSEKYLEEMIGSILRQSYTDYELILIDDGSTDKSSDICDKYALKYNKVKTIHKINSGAGAARNTGIEIASGEYIMFVDSDDFIEDDMLETMLENILDNDMLISGAIVESYIGETLNSKKVFAMPQKKYNIAGLIEDFECTYSQICLFPPWAKLYRRDIIDRYNIRFPTNMRTGEDGFFNVDYLACCKTVVAIDRELYHHRRRNINSLSSIFIKERIDNIIAEFDKLCNFALEVKCDKDCLTRLYEIRREHLIFNCYAIIKSQKENVKGKLAAAKTFVNDPVLHKTIKNKKRNGAADIIIDFLILRKAHFALFCLLLLFYKKNIGSF